MRYVGLDLSKKTIELVMLDEGGRQLDARTIPNTPSGVDDLIGRLEPSDQVAVEAGTLCYPLVDALSRAGIPAHVGDPGRLKPMMDPDVKTDHRDAWHLADILRVGRYPRVYIPDPGLFRARDLVRRRLEKGDQVTVLKNRIRAFLARYGVAPPTGTLWTPAGLKWLTRKRFGDERDTLIASYVEEFEMVARQKEHLEGELARLALESPSVRILMTVEGINLTNAFTILLESGDPSRYEDEAKYRAYAGAAPKMSDSGEVQRRGRRSRFNRRLKYALGMVTQRLIASPRPNPVQAYYRKQRRRVPLKKQAKGRARGKTTNIVRAMLQRMEPCRFADPDLVARKWRAVERQAAKAA